MFAHRMQLVKHGPTTFPTTYHDKFLCFMCVRRPFTGTTTLDRRRSRTDKNTRRLLRLQFRSSGSQWPGASIVFRYKNYNPKTSRRHSKHTINNYIAFCLTAAYSTTPIAPTVNHNLQPAVPTFASPTVSRRSGEGF